MSSDGNPGHVHPTRDDPVVASFSPVVGGPVGTRAGGGARFPVTGVLLALTALTFALGLVSKAACAADDWSPDQTRYTHVCGSQVPATYLEQGLVELAWPWSSDDATRQRYAVTDQPALVGLWSWGAAHLTHVLVGSPDLGERYATSTGDLAEDPDVARERGVFTAVNAVGLGLVALLATAALARVHLRRPWDASAFAAAPVLAAAGAVSWNLLAAAAAAAALWAWSRRRPALTGAFLGVGAAAGVWPALLVAAFALPAVRQRRARLLLPLVVTGTATWAALNAPAFLTGRDQWEVFWSESAGRGADRGTVWAVLDALAGLSPGPLTAASWILVGLWTVAVVVLALLAPVTPRPAQLGLLLVAGVVLLRTAYDPWQALWLLPLAALARPRWRDQLVWQGAEVLHLAMLWWWLGGVLDPGGGGAAGFYWVAVLVHVVATLWLVGVVVRDVWWPGYDPVAGERQVISTRSNAVAV